MTVDFAPRNWNEDTSSGALAAAAVTVGRTLVVALMGCGMVAMWIGGPIAWLWVGSQMTSGMTPAPAVAAIVLVGIALTAAAIARGLSLLDGLYCRLSRSEPAGRVRAAHLRPSCEDPAAGRRQATALDTVAVGTVFVALAAFVVWFFLIAGPPAPFAA